MSNEEERLQSQAFQDACELISLERAEQLKELKHWQQGGVLMGRPKPDFAPESQAEWNAVKAVWDEIPSGASSWMWALYFIVNNHPQRKEQAHA